MPRAAINTELYSAASHGGGAKNKVDTPQIQPITVERNRLMLTGTERRRILGKKRSSENVEFKLDLKEDYRRFLADHVQKMGKFAAGNPKFMDDPAFKADKYLLELFYDKTKGGVDQERISDFLKNENGKGWVTTTQLLEQQIALKTFGLGLMAETKVLDSTKLPRTAFGGRGLLSGLTVSGAMGQNKQALIALHQDMAGDPQRVAYFRAMTGIELNDFMVSGGEIVERTPGGGSSITEPEKIIGDLQHEAKLRKKFYGTLGVDTTKLDSTPDQALVGTTTRGVLKRTTYQGGSIERTGFVGQQQIQEIFNKNQEGERNLEGRSAESGVAFATSSRDVVGNIKRYNQARIQAMCENLQGELHDPSGVDSRISNLTSQLSKKQESQKKPLQEERSGFEATKAVADSAIESLTPLITGITQLNEAERLERATITRYFGTGTVDSNLKALRLSAASSTAPDVIIEGVAVPSIRKQENDLRAQRETVATAWKTANPKSSYELDGEYKERLDAAVAADVTVENLSIALTEGKELAQAARQATEDIKTQLEAKATELASPETEAREKKIDEFVEALQKVRQSEMFLASHGVPAPNLPGLSINNLRIESVDALDGRMNKAREQATTTVQTIGTNYIAHMSAAPFATSADVVASVGSFATTWPEAVQMAAEAHTAGLSGAEAFAKVREVIEGVSRNAATDIGWTPEENVRNRQTLVYAKTKARAIQAETLDPNYATEEPLFSDVILTGGIKEQQMRSLSLSQVKETLAQYVDSGHIVDLGGPCTSAQLRSNVLDVQLGQAMAFARKRPAFLLNELRSTERELTAGVGRTDKKIEGLDSGAEKGRIETAIGILKRQGEVLRKGVEIVRDPKEVTDFAGVDLAYDPTTREVTARTPQPVPANYSDAEKDFATAGGDRFYLSAADMLTDGFGGGTGNARAEGFKKFQKMLPPDRMLALLKTAFNFSDALDDAPIHVVIPGAPTLYRWIATTPITSLDQFAEQMKRRVDQKANFATTAGGQVGRVAGSEMIEGWTSFMNLLADEVTP